MKPRRQIRTPELGNAVKERVVGEEQQATGPRTTPRERVVAVFVWASLGLGLGSLWVVWVLSWLEDARSRGEGVELAAVATLGALVMLWVALGRRIWRLWHRSGRHARIALAACLVAIAVASLLTWAAREAAPREALFLEIGGHFAFGPYPGKEVMESLGEQNFNAVVSLLTPSGDPDWARRSREEQEMAREHGMELIAAPLLVGDSLNVEGWNVLRELADRNAGRYYVHADGDAPVRTARLLLARMTGRHHLLPDRLGPGTSFERGPVFTLGPEVFLAPFPTDGELLESYLTGSVRAVLSLLDPTDVENRFWTQRQKELLEAHGIEFREAPVGGEPFDPQEALQAVQVATSLGRPLVVQVFLSESPAADAFRQAYITGRPPLPPGLFTSPLSGGQARVIASSVAAGPRPVEREFGTLHNRGVRTIVFLGPPNSPGLDVDRQLSSAAGLDWYVHDGSEGRLLERMETGGPRYVYGPDVEAFAEQVTGRLGPPVPERTSRAADTLSTVPRTDQEEPA